MHGEAWCGLLNWHPEYTPDESDVAWITQVAMRRTSNVGGIPNRQQRSVGVGDRTAEERARIDFIGVGGEWAARMCLRLPTRWDDQARKYGSDMELNGRTIDVKTTSRAAGDIIVRIGGIEADAYLLVVATGQRFTVIGWATKEEIKDERNTGRMEDRYVFPQARLRCITTFNAWTLTG